MEYLQKEDIIFINQKTIKKHGGSFVPPYNFLKESPLDYLIAAVQTELFGKELYPYIFDKAGLYMFNIINNHIFQDGNKRTGLGAALLFLRLNGFQLKKTLNPISIDDHKLTPKLGKTSHNILLNFTLTVAEGKVTLKECQAWFKQNITEIINS